jgi:polyhydroxyalkanoate synthesis regulator phasin
MKWGLGAIGLGVAGLIAVTALGFGGAAAQTPSPANADGNGGRYGELLAAELGISVDELNEARLNARNALIDEMVAEGKISAEKGAELKAKDLGEGLREHFGDRPGAKVVKALVNVFQSAADIVGVPVDELRERIAGGESLVEIAQSKGISEDKLKTDLTAKLTADINAAVANGDLPQERADVLLDHIDEMVERAISHEGGPQPGGFGEMRRMRPGNQN